MLKVIQVSVIGVLALGVFSQPAMARDFSEIYAECGLGGIIFKDNRTVAAISNIFWDLGTTAISSNITTPDNCANGKEKTAAFIHDAYASLENDLATGSGTYLDTLTALVGCEAQLKPEFIAGLRDDFAGIVADPTYTNKSRFEKAEALYNLVYKNVEGKTVVSSVKNS
jgi:hypothetical protein